MGMFQTLLILHMGYKPNGFLIGKLHMSHIWHQNSTWSFRIGSTHAYHRMHKKNVPNVAKTLGKGKICHPRSRNCGIRYSNIISLQFLSI
ncbi:hypothetical protein Pfo_007144 [Paulownia fortunei]|nr:hypothetical protein Pfo_007144 [Paulownia fortunei]